jgi:hypothetical protein
MEQVKRNTIKKKQMHSTTTKKRRRQTAGVSEPLFQSLHKLMTRQDFLKRLLVYHTTLEIQRKGGPTLYVNLPEEVVMQRPRVEWFMNMAPVEDYVHQRTPAWVSLFYRTMHHDHRLLSPFVLLYLDCLRTTHSKNPDQALQMYRDRITHDDVCQTTVCMMYNDYFVTEVEAAPRNTLEMTSRSFLTVKELRTMAIRETNSLDTEITCTFLALFSYFYHNHTGALVTTNWITPDIKTMMMMFHPERFPLN